MRAVTGKPIKLVGTGEKVDALEEFHPSRVASRILGMGDIVSLVEKAAENIDHEQALRAVEKMRKGKFDLDDLRDQLSQMDKIGGMGGVLGMLPGIGKMKAQIEQAGLGDGMIRRQRAIIDSMTPKERRNPDLLKASRKKRIAAGSGTKVEEVNKLLKMHRQMADMMKMMGGAGGKRGLGQALGNMLGFGGGMPQPSPEMLADMQRKMGGGMPGMPSGGGLPPLPPGLSGKGPALPSGLPGLGGPKMPGLPGLGGPFNPFGGGKKR
jgi:signal recognition particle subunit SRP54